MDLQNETPATLGGVNRGKGNGGQANNLTKQITEATRKRQVKFRFSVNVEGRGTLTFEGRTAWALDQLIKAGAGGCTPITHPGPRWAAYVLKLRKAGLIIETIHERHDGPFPGNHGRYVLRTPVEIVDARGD